MLSIVKLFGNPSSLVFSSLGQSLVDRFNVVPTVIKHRSVHSHSRQCFLLELPFHVQSPWPSSSSSTTKTQTLDSTRLFLTALATFSHQPNPPQLSFPPIPSTFPHSKLIPKTRFSVDAFRHAGDHSVSYFLSHFHSDHYGGLSPNWAKGIVFCSQTTARLLNEVLKVSSLFVVALPLDEAVVIDGCEVVLIDANHCPGAVQFLFKVPGLNGSLRGVIVKYMWMLKMAVLRVLGYGESGVFTEDECESDVHVVGWNVLGETWPYFRPNFLKMKEIMVEKGYSKVVGFVPTGWTYEVKRNKFSVRSKDSFEIHLVPYSEHSNYDELREYVRFLKPKHVIPTVGLDVEKLDSKHANKMQKHFAGLVDEMANKKEFLRAFVLDPQKLVTMLKMVQQWSY
ncbi:DNA ligase 6 isoform X5 [Prunus yedoensis var. nudiflora]|uniref:DNA ligase 6 isoform X5 n=1 Tax=Prunus yedoensis var. nudiflora TaxID=2094558 RepID=A0A314Z047_PRUYE|nr:DNA ligase 6 isoform X5 [Prunus yedoensis var. nudiflora]